MAENTQGTDTPTTVTVPDKPALEGLEEKYSQQWREQGTFAFDANTTREQVYSIDTPPPTASGSLHVGHMFSYTQTDVIARYQRMTGKNVFYPLGWDDNGLPTERRVQNYYGVRCDPALHYVEGYRPPEKPAKNQRDWDVVSRRNFIELCEELAVEDEKVFEHLFATLGLSVDWTRTYRTIDDHSRKVSQLAFLKDLEAGNAYMAEAPTMWDVTFRTAVAQAEIEDKEREGAYHRVSFHAPDGQKVFIETTRPELLPACVALVAHPDDERYQPLFGTTVRSPLFDVEVEVKAHPLAQPDKGSGIAMICTFGDLTDVTWWRELELPTRALIGRDGRFASETPEWISDGAPSERYTNVAGKTVFSAQQAVVEMLRESGDLEGEPKKITHPVNFYEKGDKPLEVVTSRQWYIRNGGRDAARREALINRGREMQWHPGFMRSRYENWIEGLNGDWLISRQRYFGVPIPVWYPVNNDGDPDYENPVLPSAEQLPVDPAAEPAPGYTEDQRDQPGGFTGDPDVLDTWATSSLTPQIATGWAVDDALHQVTFPMDLRPQGHDIIRTWLFSTAVRSNSLEDSVPWTNTALSGWILDPDRKKMSKSKGNVVVPNEVLEKYGSDAVRYWAASARLGADTAYDEGQMKIGRRLAIKLLNAAKFVLGQGVTEASVIGGDVSSTVDASVLTNDLDRALLQRLAEVVAAADSFMQMYMYSVALQRVETFFWTFTDDYVELVKDRAYGARGDAEQASVHAALATTLDTVLRLFAPFIPFATEEVWSWWRSGSVHNQTWPRSTQWPWPTVDSEALDTVSQALSGLRKSKSEAKVKQRTEVLSGTVTGSAAQVAQLQVGLEDLKAAGNAREITLTEGVIDDGGLLVTDVVLADPEETPAG
ncbi:valine--tRNA ligase [Kocuria soli]|uniref:Valine--tRNA ligase n=1 Tax=Kocuria soli TaxID=2485125 RepID=A0A3N3ZVD4_9MICC|nr:valine--tRNA ligase [Kocuria soli]ROZ64597.1 valine--tRNA ligase [Kocuria soli]